MESVPGVVCSMGVCPPNVVPSLSCFDSATPWTEVHQASLSFTISWSLLKLTFIESMMPSNRLILCHPLLLLASIFPRIRVFSKESALCIRWPKYRSFSICSPNEYSVLISFRIDWFHLLPVQGTQESSPAPQALVKTNEEWSWGDMTRFLAC